MFCTQCGVELQEKDRFCSQCGHATAVAPPKPVDAELALDVENKKIAGVCAGFARYLGVDVIMVRVVWLSLAFITGFGFIAYLIAWILMPKRKQTVPSPAAQLSPQTN